MSIKVLKKKTAKNGESAKDLPHFLMENELQYILVSPPCTLFHSRAVKQENKVFHLIKALSINFYITYRGLCKTVVIGQSELDSDSPFVFIASIWRS
ncbi:MAG: hypothetical protein U5K72_18665 [Balneolaceae bacterium]|nr:hypothetical protein [Balneolaceae bacterium]